jgi:lipopolysaccharide/colanic/teichoic acid biosynthesis glycosyltransferase
MLILGEKYKFTHLEINRLSEKFSSINSIIYKDKKAVDVIKEIESIILKDKFNIMVLNTKEKVDDEIIKYLTNLKYNEKTKHIRLIGIDHFLEEYLYKCYIPESNNDLHFLDDIKPFNIWQRIEKQIINIIFIIALFLIFIFVRLIVKKKIKEQSEGSLYFKQNRVGLNNKEFECIKFRSMHENAEKDGIKFASKNDNRTFPFGEFMRKTRIDEIPQLFNMIKNDMNLIGPRPERKYWIEKDFEKNIPYYNQRHIIKPGITGWAQVMYPYGDGIDDARQKLMYDMYYIKYWNIWLELKIIFKTFLVIGGKKGI